MNWQLLETRFPAAVVRLLRERFDTPGSFSTTVRDLARDSGVNEREVEALLATLVGDGALTKNAYLRCAECGGSAEEDDAECRACGISFGSKEPIREVRYQLDRKAPRDVPWVLVLHGMNTHGTWQEELTWLIARSYKRMVPVAIYKYGTVRPGALFAWRQRMILRRVIAKFVALSEQARDAELSSRPDVIAHSFGTWLIAHALADPRVRIGRLILLGSIVRPDFPWQQWIDEKKVEFVLNHGATKDFWVKAAQFAIPDSGPGGRIGYLAPVRNVAAEGLGHSDYFNPQSRMRDLFTTVWRPFLSWQNDPPLNGFDAPRWRPVPRPLRAVTWLLAVGAFLTIAGGVAVTFVYGLWCML